MACHTVKDISGGVMAVCWGFHGRMNPAWGVLDSIGALSTAAWETKEGKNEEPGSQILLLISTTRNTRGYEVTWASVGKLFQDLETFKACAAIEITESRIRVQFPCPFPLTMDSPWLPCCGDKKERILLDPQQKTDRRGRRKEWREEGVGLVTMLPW